MKTTYIDAIRRIERLHRQCLEAVKDELDRARVRDLTPVQAMILFNMDDGEVTVSDLSRRGCYQGSNVSYNVRKLVDLGYLEQHRGEHDRRSTYIRRTARGEEIRALLDGLFAVQADELSEREVALEPMADGLDHLERFYAGARSMLARRNAYV